MTDAELKALFANGKVIQGASFEALVSEFSTRISQAGGGGANIYKRDPMEYIESGDTDLIIDSMFSEVGFYLLAHEAVGSGDVHHTYHITGDGSHGPEIALGIEVDTSSPTLVYCSTPYSNDNGDVTYPEVEILSASRPQIHYVYGDVSQGDEEIDLTLMEDIQQGEIVRVLLTPSSEHLDNTCRVHYAGNTLGREFYAYIPAYGYVDFLKIDDYGNFIAPLTAITEVEEDEEEIQE